MRQIDVYFTYLKQAFNTWRQVQRIKLIMWLEAKKTCLKCEVAKDITLVKSRSEMILRLGYLKLLGKIITKLDDLITRGNYNRTY